jgi:hypothetical protein
MTGDLDIVREELVERLALRRLGRMPLDAARTHREARALAVLRPHVGIGVDDSDGREGR